MVQVFRKKSKIAIAHARLMAALGWISAAQEIALEEAILDAYEMACRNHGFEPIW